MQQTGTKNRSVARPSRAPRRRSRSASWTGSQKRHRATCVMLSAAQGASLLLSWRPDRERRRLPAGTGDLDIGLHVSTKRQKQGRGVASRTTPSLLSAQKRGAKRAPRYRACWRRFPLSLDGVKVKSSIDLKNEKVARSFATDRKEEPSSSPPQQSATQTEPITF